MKLTTKQRTHLGVVLAAIILLVTACTPAERPEPQQPEPTGYQRQNPGEIEQQRDPAGFRQEGPTDIQQNQGDQRLDQQDIGQQGIGDQINNIDREQLLRRGTPQPGGMQFQTTEGSEEKALEQENTTTGEEHGTGRIN